MLYCLCVRLDAPTEHVVLSRWSYGFSTVSNLALCQYNNVILKCSSLMFYFSLSDQCCLPQGIWGVGIPVLNGEGAQRSHKKQWGKSIKVFSNPFKRPWTVACTGRGGKLLKGALFNSINAVFVTVIIHICILQGAVNIQCVYVTLKKILLSG